MSIQVICHKIITEYQYRYRIKNIEIYNHETTVK
jgi:hypothetical protein